MSDLEKVKPKKADYEWYQDGKYVKIRIPIHGVTSNKIDVFVAEVILKINVPTKNFVVIFDLEKQVLTDTKDCKFVYSNGILEVNLIKQTQNEEWSDLIIKDLSKEEIKERRVQAFKKQEAIMQEYQKNRTEQKWKFDSQATREQMNQEDKLRNQLQTLKKEEKQEAEQALFGGDESTIQQRAGITEKTEYVYAKKIDMDIFSDKDLNEYERQIKEYAGEIPKPRQQTTVNVQFTDKIYPGVAMRETHLKDAPMPKMMHKQFDQGTEVDQKNPLWLKDKADEFYRNKDYFSALNAYGQAWKLDKNFIECVANRSAIYIHLFGYDEVITDCDTVLTFIENLKDEDEKKQKLFLLVVKSKLRKCIAQSWKGQIDDSMENFDKLLEFCLLAENKDKIPENITKQIHDSHEIVKQRSESIKIKKQGDIFYAEAEYEKALELYEQALEVDNNETALGNISITMLKLKREQDCINYCDQCIKKVKDFTQYSNFNPSFKTIGADDQNQFLMKLYLRKSKAHLNLDQPKLGFDTIKSALQIDERNKEARQIFSELEKKMNTQKVLSLKQEAAKFMKEQKIKEALDIYNECLKVLDSSETIEYLALLLNRCVCFLHLQQYEDIISSSLRGLKIIRSQKKRVISWDKSSMSKENKEKLNNFEVRFLVRRSNAYLKQNLVNNAKNDLAEALKLDPENAQLKQDLNNLENNIINQ